MIYNDVVEMFRSVSLSLAKDIYYNEGPQAYQNREDVLNQNQWGAWLLPMTPSGKPNSSYKTWEFIIAFYKQTPIDTLQDGLRQIVHDAESLADSFFDKLDDYDLIQFDDIKFSPGYKRLDNSFTGGALSGKITLPASACVIFEDEENRTGTFDISFDFTFS